MKNLFSLKTVKKAAWLVGLSLSALAVVNCTTDETIDLEEGNSLESTLSNNLSSKSVEIGVSSISASTQQSANPASNAIDNSSSSRWSGFGTSVNLDLDLGSTANIDYIKVAFYKGNERKAKFKVFTSSNKSSWTQINSKTSSGSTTGLQTFDLSNSSARYLRLQCNGNSNNNWNSITDLQVWGSGGGPVDNGGNDDSPGGVLNIDNDDWKLNGFTANPSSTATYYDDVAKQVGENISTWSNPNYFYELDGWAVFKCYRGLGTSKNSDNPRTELRERDGNGNNASWRNEDNNTMQFTFRVDQLSNNKNNNAGVVSIGQIHGPSDNDNVDDIVRVQFHGDAGQKSGGVRIKISGDVADANGGSRFIDNGYQLDTSYVMSIKYESDDSVVVKINGSTIYDEKMDEDEDENYFKVGCYLQESDGASFDGSSAIVRIKNLSLF